MSASIDPRKLIKIGLRWWWLIILLPAVTTGSGYYFKPEPEIYYVATTTLRVGQFVVQNIVDNTEFFDNQELMFTYANLIGRYPVLQGVIDNLDLNSNWRDLRGRVEAKPVLGTELLEITVRASSPDEAEAIADELANQLVRLSKGHQDSDVEDQRFVRERLNKLQAKMEAGQERLEILEATLDNPLSVEQVQTLQQEMSTLETLMISWESNYGQLLTYLDKDRGRNELTVIEPAISRSFSSQTQPLLYPLVGGAIGLALALGTIFLLEILDDTLKSEDDINQELGLYTLGAISQIKGKDYHTKLVAIKDPFSGPSETYRKIRSNMQFLSVDQPAKSIMVTSSSSGEGKSLTAANLAVVMAQAGFKTIIVDGDLRRPVQHQIFQIPNLGGLTELLCSSEPDLKGHLRKVGVENLLLITCGMLPPNPSELLGSQRMRQLMNNLNDIADIIIFDSPPVLPVTDALVLSNQVDGVILVVQAGKVRRSNVKRTLANLQQADANVFGVVLNGMSGKVDSQYAYQQYYTPTSYQLKNHLSQIKPKRRWQWIPFIK